MEKTRTLADAKRELKDEVKKTLFSFLDLDIEIYGKIQPSTLECFKVQNVELPKDYQLFIFVKMVEYLPIRNSKKPFKYKNEWFTRNEFKTKYPDLDYLCTEAILNYSKIL